jgi:regulator of protease activity HflC (stomatin/prohibitin superfamily)
MGFLDEDNAKPALGACCCFSATITAIVLLSLSFHRLDELDYGLNYNAFYNTLEDKVYDTAGLYSLGPSSYFITYPRTVQTIEFISDQQDQLQTRTSDGLPVTLGISFQYRYDPARIRDLYLMFKNNQTEVYENTAKANIANSATNYSAYSFFNDKQMIATSMQISLSRVFDEQLFALLDAFQITQVELPAQFQEAILASIAAKQAITRTQRQKENMRVTFESQELVANETKKQTIALSRGTASRILQEAEALAQTTIQTVTSEMHAYGNVSKTVGLDTDAGLSYIWWDMQREATGKEYLVGLNPGTYISNP